MNAAVVDDLQLSPALCLLPTSLISSALQLAFEREFSVLPIVSNSKQLLGYVTAEALKKEMELPETENKTVAQLSTGSFKRFQREKEYIVITPMTSLSELSEFLKKTDAGFAIVSDSERKFVLGVVTKEDLANFIKRRNPHGV